MLEFSGGREGRLVGEIPGAQLAGTTRSVSWVPGSIGSSQAVDIMDTVRRNHLSISANIVACLKMLVMLGTLRYQLATDYALAGLALLGGPARAGDPRRRWWPSG